MLQLSPKSTLFPTRRSSDLQARESRPPAKIKSKHHEERRQFTIPGAAQSQEEASPMVGVYVDRAAGGHRHHCDPCQHVVAGDRKSTRLNSSHVAISYAVFCL